MTEGKPELTTVSIDGITVDDFLIKWEKQSTMGSSPIKVMKIRISRAAASILDFDGDLSGSSVIVQRGVAVATEQYVFRGEIINVIPDGGNFVINAADRLYEATKKTVTKSYDIDIDPEAGVISEIALDLITTYTSLNADSSTFQDSGSVLTLNKFICRAATVFDRVSTLAEALGWRVYYNPEDDKVYFEPNGYTSQSTNIQDGENLIRTPEWNYDSSKLYNEIVVRGAWQEVETTESGQIGVTSGYTTDSVQLTYKPISTKVYVAASSPPTTLKKGGILNSTGTFDYEVDPEEKKIVWSDSFTPGGSDYVTINYSYPLPVPVIVKDEASIQNYSINGESKKIEVFRYDIINVSDAEVFANHYLEQHKDPILKTTLAVTNIEDLEVGQKVHVTDSFNDIDQDFYIESIKTQYPYRADELNVADKIFDDDLFSVKKRVKRLEESNLNDSELLVHVFGNNSVNSFENRYISIEKTVYGSPVFGEDGLDFPIDFGADTTIPTLMMPGNNHFKEFIYDDEFYDSGDSSGVEWESNRQYIYINGTLYTENIAYGNNYVYFTVNVNFTDEVGTVEISGDGGTTYQSVTLGSKTPFTSYDRSGVKLKITGTDDTPTFGTPPAGIGFPITFDNLHLIENEYNVDGSYKNPGIQVKLEQ
jgi:hypothetical protein